MLATTIFTVTLIVATLFCTLVTGIVLGFAIVVMPGIKNLNDREFIRAFQLMDGIIQNNQPIFVAVWIGSVLTIVISAVLGFGQLDTIGRTIIVIATLLYVIGVQLPTVMINIPLNNQLQTLTVDTMSESEQEDARLNFEPRWNQWNTIRTAFAILASLLLITLLFTL